MCSSTSVSLSGLERKWKGNSANKASRSSSDKSACVSWSLLGLTGLTKIGACTLRLLRYYLGILRVNTFFTFFIKFISQQNGGTHDTWARESVFRSRDYIVWGLQRLEFSSFSCISWAAFQLWLPLSSTSVTEGFSTFERFEHSTGTRRFNYRLTGGN